LTCVVLMVCNVGEISNEASSSSFEMEKVKPVCVFYVFMFFWCDCVVHACDTLLNEKMCETNMKKKIHCQREHVVAI